MIEDKIYINTREELDNLLENYPSGSPRVVIGKDVVLGEAFRFIKSIDISNWDVSNVRDMSYIFHHSKFNGNISKWDVSNVRNMTHMFSYSKFNKNI